MPLHLFSTPVQCTQCGTTVEDPSVERCPNCGSRLKERRAPRRLAGVEQRYGSLRVLLGIMRFLGVIVFAIGALIFFSSLGTSRTSAQQSGALFVGGILVAVVFLAAAGLFELLIDVEENTRSSFKLQQMILEELAEARPPAPTPEAAAAAPAPVASAPVAAPAADGPLAPAVA
jgi:DNA-directed RNA polymerase subunit RPC12/RpoP